VPLAPSMPKVCLGIRLVVTPATKTPFLVNKSDARRLSNDATEFRRLDISPSFAKPLMKNQFLYLVRTWRSSPPWSSSRGGRWS